MGSHLVYDPSHTLSVKISLHSLGWFRHMAPLKTEEAHRLFGMTLFERSLSSYGYQMICGIDEAGRGPLAGPVVAAAVILPSGYTAAGIRASKLLTEKQRERSSSAVRTEQINFRCSAAFKAKAKAMQKHKGENRSIADVLEQALDMLAKHEGYNG